MDTTRIVEAAVQSVRYYYEKTGGRTVPAFVITWSQRKALVADPPDPFSFEPGYRGPDTLRGIPCFVTPDLSWNCPVTLVDLRGVE